MISTSSDTSSTVVVERLVMPSAGEVGVVTVWLNRPTRRNAVDTPTIIDLGHVIRRLSDDPSVGVVVLRGVSGMFCAGADVGDLHTMLQRSDAELEAQFQQQLAVLDAWRNAGVLTVALIEGVALGFGLALAAVCDRVIASADAVLGLPEIRLGMAPAMVFDALLTRMPLHHATHLASSGNRYGAPEAMQLGLVDRVVVAAEQDVAGQQVMTEALMGDLGAAGQGNTDAVRHLVSMVRRRRDGNPGDAAIESVRALRSPQVALALGQRQVR